MKVRDTRREAVLEAAADYVLAEGLPTATLRRIGAATGTSDRMLLYYFRDKDELMAEALGTIAARLATLLDAGNGPEPLPLPALLAQMRAAMKSDALRPYMRLWLELCAAAAGGQEPYRTIAGGIADGFIGWAEERLLVEQGVDRRAEAALLVATIDGLALLDTTGRGDIADPAIFR